MKLDNLYWERGMMIFLTENRVDARWLLKSSDDDKELWFFKNSFTSRFKTRIS